MKIQFLVGIRAKKIRILLRTAGFVEDKWVPEIYQVGHIIHRNNPTEIFSLFKPSIDHAIIQLQSKSINLDFDDRIEMNLTLIAWKYRSWRIV